MSVDPDSGQVSGFLVQGSQKMQFGGNFATRMTVTEIQPETGATASCGNDLVDMSQGSPVIEVADIPQSLSAAAAGSTITYETTIAIETDTEWMARFNNDADAMDWISDLFLAMNVFFERDLETRLLIGDVSLRSASDPYSVPSGTSAQLDEFAEYWTNNMGHIDRTFAAMFSSRGISNTVLAFCSPT